jgi:hypothetical protein
LQHASFVGMLDARTGAVAWRHDLSTDGPIDNMHQSGRVRVTISGGGKFVRMFSGADGLPIWDDLTGVTLEKPPEPFSATRNALSDVKVRIVADVDGDEMEDVALLAVKPDPFVLPAVPRARDRPSHIAANGPPRHASCTTRGCSCTVSRDTAGE